MKQLTAAESKSAVELDLAWAALSPNWSQLEGVMLCVDKTQPSGAKFASYSIRLGSVPTPFSRLVSQMTDDEVSAHCRLEDTVGILSNDEEWTRLQNTGLSSETIATIRSNNR